MPLTPVEYDAIWQVVYPQDRCVVVDLRESQPTYRLVGFLPHCRDGVYSDACSDPLSAPMTDWKHVCLMRERDELSGEYMAYYASLAEKLGEGNCIALRHTAAGIVPIDPPQEAPPRRPGPRRAEIVVNGVETVECVDLLPVTLSFQLVQEHQNYFRASVEDVSDSETCFQVAGTFGQLAQVRLVPDLRDGNRLKLLPVRFVDAIQKVDPEKPRFPRKIALIFDRTCPSSCEWDSAYFLVRGLGKAIQEEEEAIMSEDRLERSSDDRSSTNQDQVAALNAEIREGLAAAFRLTPMERCQIRLYAFADKEGGGLDFPELFDRPARETFCVGTLSNEEAIHRMQTSSFWYSPGLDVWDPLDGAIRLALDNMRQDKNFYPVIIVGNSPPRMPESLNNPFKRIRREPHFVSTSGATSSTFEWDVDFLQEQGAKIIYLFLRGHVTTNKVSSYDNFLHLQQLLSDALREYFPVIDAEANHVGVQGGFQRAMSLLAEPSYLRIQIGEDDNAH
ncbi:hypothetical protein LOC68_01715 [Blastopirellula sp. JC732]|uniref:Uncharacterized protein n=1 Tax=Blastopirellula sediminis TaxID=2894196 RepID=A0A9X1MJK4_9BACT|nr:hypothetical protein [Blastopirellula sediminis]MCC9608095.1 hypothetical protein [Blastopirellula sediminis]MCC9627112.1 hypothetical protein [Blastopirellula sediminis]